MQGMARTSALPEADVRHGARNHPDDVMRSRHADHPLKLVAEPEKTAPKRKNPSKTARAAQRAAAYRAEVLQILGLVAEMLDIPAEPLVAKLGGMPILKARELEQLICDQLDDADAGQRVRLGDTREEVVPIDGGAPLVIVNLADLLTA